MEPPAPPRPPPPGFTDRLRAWLRGGAAPEAALGLAPPWAAWPDYERVENLNALVAALWPHAAPAAEALLRDAAAGALAGAPPALGAWGFGLEGVELAGLSLGDAPPRLAALKTYRAGSEEQVGAAARTGCALPGASQSRPVSALPAPPRSTARASLGGHSARE